MKKKIFVQPKVKVVKLEQMSIICTSTGQIPSTQNESYEEMDESLTDDWY